MASAPRIPSPTRVQWHAAGGPILHYDRLTREQVEALDFDTSDSEFYGASIQRLRKGGYRVRARITAIARGETAYKTFRDQLLAGIAGGACHD